MSEDYVKVWRNESDDAIEEAIFSFNTTYTETSVIFEIVWGISDWLSDELRGIRAELYSGFEKDAKKLLDIEHISFGESEGTATISITNPKPEWDINAFKTTVVLDVSTVWKDSIPGFNYARIKEKVRRFEMFFSSPGPTIYPFVLPVGIKVTELPIEGEFTTVTSYSTTYTDTGSRPSITLSSMLSPTYGGCYINGSVEVFDRNNSIGAGNQEVTYKSPKTFDKEVFETFENEGTLSDGTVETHRIEITCDPFLTFNFLYSSEMTSDSKLQNAYFPMTYVTPPLRLPIIDWDVTVNEDQIDLTFNWGIPEDEYRNLRSSEAYIQSDVNCTEQIGYPMFLERNFEAETLTNPDETKYPNYKFYKATATLTKTAFEANSGGKTWSWVTDNLRFIWVKWTMFGKEAYPNVFPCGIKVTSFPWKSDAMVFDKADYEITDSGIMYHFSVSSDSGIQDSGIHINNDITPESSSLTFVDVGPVTSSEIEQSTASLNLVEPFITMSATYSSQWFEDTALLKSYIPLSAIPEKQEEWDPSTAEGQKVKTAYAIFYDESDYGQTTDWTNQQLKVPAIFDEVTKTYAIQTTSLMYTSWHQPDHMYKVKLFAEDEAGNLASMDHTDATYGQELRVRVLEKDPPRFGEDPYWVSDGAVIGKTLSIKPFNLTDTPEANTEIKGNIYRTSGIDNSSFKVYLDDVQIAADHEWGWNARLNNEADPDCRIQGSTEAQYPFELTDLAGGNHTLKYEISDNDGNTATKQSTFMVHANGPELEIVDPAADIDINTTSYSLKFRAKSTDNVEVSKFVILIQDGRYETWNRTIAVTNIPAADADGYINVTQNLTNLYDEGPSLPRKVPNIITVTAYDAVGSTTVVTRTITVDTIPPVIYDVSAENTTIDATTGKIKIQFRLIDTSVTPITVRAEGDDNGGRKEVEVGSEVTPTIVYKMEPDVSNLPGFRCEYQEAGVKIEDLAKTSLGNGLYKFTGVNSKFVVEGSEEKNFCYKGGAPYRTPDHVVTGTWAPYIPENHPEISRILPSEDTMTIAKDSTLENIRIEGVVNGDRKSVGFGKIQLQDWWGPPEIGGTQFNSTIYSIDNNAVLTSTNNPEKPNEYTYGFNFPVSRLGDGYSTLTLYFSENGSLGGQDASATPLTVFKDGTPNITFNGSSITALNIDLDTTSTYTYAPKFTFKWGWGYNSRAYTGKIVFPEAPDESKRATEVSLTRAWDYDTKTVSFSGTTSSLKSYLPDISTDAAKNALFGSSSDTTVTKTIPQKVRVYTKEYTDPIIEVDVPLEITYTRTIKTPTIEATSPSDKLSTESAVRVNALTSITFSGTSTNADRVEYQYFTTTDDTAPDEGASSGDCNLSEDGTWSVSITFRKYDNSSRRAYVKFVAFNGDISTATSTYVFYIPMAS